MGENANLLRLVETKHTKLSDAKVKKWWGQREVDWCDVQVEDGGRGLIYSWKKRAYSKPHYSKREKMVLC